MHACNYGISLGSIIITCIDWLVPALAASANSQVIIARFFVRFVFLRIILALAEPVL